MSWIDRNPPPPAALVDARQDAPHQSIGKGRPANTSKNKRKRMALLDDHPDPYIARAARDLREAKLALAEEIEGHATRVERAKERVREAEARLAYVERARAAEPR